MKRAYLTTIGKVDIVVADYVQDLNCGIQSAIYKNLTDDVIDVEPSQSVFMELKTKNTCELENIDTGDYFKDWTNVTDDYVELDSGVYLPSDEDLQKYGIVLVGLLDYPLDNNTTPPLARQIYKANRATSPHRIEFNYPLRGDYVRFKLRRK